VAAVPVASSEIGNRPTALHVRRNTKFELCENSASSVAVAAAAIMAHAHHSIAAPRCAALNVDSNGCSAPAGRDRKIFSKRRK
jgi:hypothetical protein